MNSLVAYFSCSGVTKGVASRIANIVGADLFEIEPEIPYTEDDLNWMNKESRTSLEMNDLSSRPLIKSKIDDINKYDVIYVGFPIWWYVCPTIINTFLESYDFSNKRVVPFFTSGSSGAGKTIERLRISCNGNIVDPVRIDANISDDDIKNMFKSE